MQRRDLTFLEAERLNDKEIMIAFSDGTSAVYGLEQILGIPAERLTEQELEQQELGNSDQD